jgi:hypothetical protein
VLEGCEALPQPGGACETPVGLPRLYNGPTGNELLKEVTVAADDVYLALVKLDDPEVLAATSSVAQLGVLALTNEERKLVQDVIDEARSGEEVNAFSGGAMFGALNYCSGQVSPGVLQGNPPTSFSFGALVGPTWGEASCGAGTCTADPKKKMPGDGGFGLG